MLQYGLHMRILHSTMQQAKWLIAEFIWLHTVSTVQCATTA